MSSALIITTGTRSDIESILSLSQILLSSPNFTRIHLCLPPEFLSLIPSNADIVPHSLPLSMKPHTNPFPSLKSMATLQRRKSQDDKLRQANTSLAQLLKKIVVLSMPKLIEIAQKSNPALIICTQLTTAISHTLAEYVRVPLCILNFQPATHTMKYPYPFSDAQSCIKAADDIVALHDGEARENASNIASFDNALDALHAPALCGLNCYRKSLGMPALEPQVFKDAFAGRLHNVVVCNAYAEQLIPRDASWPASIRSVPPLGIDYVPLHWSAETKCPKLVKYLSEGEKPFCITFGSIGMVNRRTGGCRSLLSALRNAGMQRVLLLKGKVESEAIRIASQDRDLNKWVEQHVYFCDERPYYAWLFPQCAAVMCHGGANTVYTALKVGLPVAVAPLICEQIFMGRLIEGMGLGCVVQEKDYEKALSGCMNEQIRKRVEDFSRRMKEGEDDGALLRIVQDVVDGYDGLSARSSSE